MPMEVEEHGARDDNKGKEVCGRVFRVPGSSKYKLGGGLRREERESMKNVNHTHSRNTKQLECLEISSLSRFSSPSPKPCSRVDVVNHINFNCNYNLHNPSLWAKANLDETETMEWTNARARLGGRPKKMESVDMVTNVTYIPGVES